MAEGERIRPLTRDELGVAIDWAAAEGWEPGLGDADAFWAADPEGFWGIEFEGELAGSISVVSYGAAFGFVGFYIVRPELRGRGIGRRLWGECLETLRGRLRPGAAIGLDGVFEQQGSYAEWGFALSHRGLRLQGPAPRAPADDGPEPLGSIPFEEVAEFDRAHFGFGREEFLRRWIAPAGGAGLGLREGGRLRAMGVIRPCRSVHKIGPLFAEDPADADRLFLALAGTVTDGPIVLDAPEVNGEAIALGERHGLRQVFGCARMYLGPAPALPWERIYGTTSFELG